jgi:hypothetical protein
MPKNHPNFNPGPSQLGLSGGAGKGSADRSPGWRQHYDEISWPVTIDDDGSVRRAVVDTFFRGSGGKLIKRYN